MATAISNTGTTNPLALTAEDVMGAIGLLNPTASRRRIFTADDLVKVSAQNLAEAKVRDVDTKSVTDYQVDLETRRFAAKNGGVASSTIASVAPEKMLRAHNFNGMLRA